MATATKPAPKAEGQVDYVVKTSGVKAPEKPITFYENPEVTLDIANYRKSNPAFDAKAKAMSRDELEQTYLLKIMTRDGYQPGLHTGKDIADWRQANPSLDQRVKVMPRERLENDLVLTQMRREGYDHQLQKYQRFFNAPENAELKAMMDRSIAHIRKPDERIKQFKQKAPQILRMKGISI